MYSKYLIDLGLKDWVEEDNQDLLKQGKVNKLLEYNVHKEHYGIDPRDTYDVEQSIYEYIYCILMEYRKQLL